MKRTDTLFLIPARGGSKGIPDKNRRLLHGKPLIHYSIDFARHYAEDSHIILSTEDDEIVTCAKEIALPIPYSRPPSLATDKSGMEEVVRHLLEQDFVSRHPYSYLCLLQPTSPLRAISRLDEAYSLMTQEVDLVLGVKEVTNNPFYLLYEESDAGHLKKYSSENLVRRQDAKKLYEVNGALYLFRISSILEKGWVNDFNLVRRLPMSEHESLDLDTETDWSFCEFLMNR